MKQTKNRVFFTLSLFFALIMLLFSFVTLAWFSDRGFQFGFEVPVRINKGFFTSLGDVIWMAAPFCLLLSLLLCTFGKGGKDASLLLAPIAPLLSVLVYLFAFLFGNQSHLTIFIPLFFVFLLSTFAITSAFEPSVKKIGARLCFFYVGVEVLLLILSFILKEKLSFYYFYEILPFNHYDHIHFSYFVISIFLNYLSFALSLGFMLCLKEEKEEAKEEKEPPSPPSPEETDQAEEEDKEEEELIPLTLEDLGIER